MKVAKFKQIGILASIQTTYSLTALLAKLQEKQKMDQVCGQ
jgi:hypothetical protein